MLKRIWLLFSVLWALFLIGLNLMHGSTQWVLVLGVAVSPFVAGIAVHWIVGFVVFGHVGRFPGSRRRTR